MRNFGAYTVLLVISGIGCGRDNSDPTSSDFINPPIHETMHDPSNDSDPASRVEATSDSSVFSQILNGPVSFTCGKDCIPSTGIMVSLKSIGTTSKCGFSLVGEDTVLTAAHCLPDVMRHSGAYCNGLMEFIFPKTDESPIEKRECSKISMVSNSKFAPQTSFEKLPPSDDFAFIKLDRSPSRPRASLVSQGVVDHTKVRMTKIRLSQDSRGFVVSSSAVDCQINLGSLFSLYYSDLFGTPLSWIQTISECQIEHGDSGSGLFLEDGRMVSMLIEGVLPEDVSTFQSTMANVFSEASDFEFTSFGIAIRPQVLLQLPSRESKLKELDRAELKVRLQRFFDFLEASETPYVKENLSLGRAVQFKHSILNLFSLFSRSFRVVETPTCISPHYLNSLIDNRLSKPVLNFEAIDTYQYSLSKFASITTGSPWQPQLRASLEFNSQDLKANGSTQALYKIVTKDGNTLRAEILLQICDKSPS